jgi:hypothetical protein
MPRRGPAATIEENQARQVRVAFEQRRQLGIDPSVNPAVRQMPFEQPQDRQRLDYVAQ